MSLPKPKPSPFVFSNPRFQLNERVYAYHDESILSFVIEKVTMCWTKYGLEYNYGFYDDTEPTMFSQDQCFFTEADARASIPITQVAQ